jgi:hypothetical protein
MDKKITLNNGIEMPTLGLEYFKFLITMTVNKQFYKHLKMDTV